MRRATAALLGLVLLYGCGSAAPSPTPSPTPGVTGFYLRAWLEQALPPEHTFGWLPLVTIDEGLLIDGNIAVPAIFPGPLVVMPEVRGITGAGQAQIVQLARELGLLGGQADFTGGGLMPGGTSAHVEIAVDGTTHRLVGSPDALAEPQPGSPGAFALFWQRLTALPQLIPQELGPSARYGPAQIALVSLPPSADGDGNVIDWPLTTSFAELGQPWAMPDSRCALIEGADLEALLPILLAATQIDTFADDAGEERRLLVRPLFPREPPPCAD